MVRAKDIMLEPLKLPTGWIVLNHRLYDIDPDPSIVVEGAYHETLNSYFEQELFYAQHPKSDWILNLDWTDPFGLDGEYVLSMIKTNFKVSEPVDICRTKDRKEIIEVLNRTMFQLSFQSGDYQREDLILQDFIIYSGHTITLNQFFQNDLTVEQSQLNRHLLRIETGSRLTAERIDLWWEYDNESSGKYMLKIFLDNDFEDAAHIMETTHREEVPQLIYESFVWKSNLSNRRKKKKKK